MFYRTVHTHSLCTADLCSSLRNKPEERFDIALIDFYTNPSPTSIRLQVSLLEGQVNYLRALADAQQGEIEELQRQVKKLVPKKAPAKKRTPTTTTVRRKRDMATIPAKMGHLT